MDLEKKKKIRFHTMAVILIIIFCAAITPVTLQNDTYYTIKIGEQFYSSILYSLKNMTFLQIQLMYIFKCGII